MYPTCHFASASPKVHPPGRHREYPEALRIRTPRVEMKLRLLRIQFGQLANSFTAILPSLCRECRSFSLVSRPRSDERTENREFSLARPGRIGKFQEFSIQKTKKKRKVRRDDR